MHWCICNDIQSQTGSYMLYHASMAKKPHRHKDPTRQKFKNAPHTGPQGTKLSDPLDIAPHSIAVRCYLGKLWYLQKAFSILSSIPVNGCTHGIFVFMCSFGLRIPQGTSQAWSILACYCLLFSGLLLTRITGRIQKTTDSSTKPYMVSGLW